MAGLSLNAGVATGARERDRLFGRVRRVPGRGHDCCGLSFRRVVSPLDKRAVCVYPSRPGLPGLVVRAVGNTITNFFMQERSM